MKEKNIKTQRGTVVSKSGDKSIKVQIDYLEKHPRYGKYIRKRTRLGVDDPKNNAGVGDVVEIAQCRPISKTKSWRLVRIIEKSVM